MRVVHLSIRNFRGISRFDWSPSPRGNCLVGVGDSAKTTILEALEMALFPRSWIQFVDSDFLGGNTRNTIEIIATVVDPPQSLTTKDKFGLHLRGWTQAQTVRDEPEDSDEDAMSIRLRVDEYLEPTWHVVNDRVPDGVYISSRDRELLAVARVGDDVERQLSWVRGSSLPRVTDDPSSVSAALSDAHRIARDAVSESSFPKLTDTAKKVGDWGSDYGAYFATPLDVGVDPRQLNVASGALSLKQATGIPARAGGLGSRRLLALAIQHHAIGKGVVTLVDEIEHGLEPHRLRHLLVELGKSDEQVIVTTHSPIAIAELGTQGLAMVRRDKWGRVDILHPDSSLQPVIRSLPEAFLAKRIIVCEGKTEFGMARGLVAHWDMEHGKRLATVGSVFVNGEGSKAARQASSIARLGFQCALWADSDVETNPPDTDLVDLGVEVIRWPGNVCTDERILLDLPPNAIQELWQIAAELKSEQSLSDKLASEMTLQGSVPHTWHEWTGTYQLDDLRAHLGRAANSGGWFKDIAAGEKVGEVVARQLSQIPETGLATTLTRVQAFAYGD